MQSTQVEVSVSEFPESALDEWFELGFYKSHQFRKSLKVFQWLCIEVIFVYRIKFEVER